VHAGIIEPGHFRFQAVGETVLNLEERLGYVHKGIEKRAQGRDATSLLRLAARVSGDSTVAHAWAACMAMERAAGIEVPARGLWLRALLAERERVINHLWDIAAICNDVAFTFTYYQFGRLRELWLRENARTFGHRLLMEALAPGGSPVDLQAEASQRLREQAARLPGDIDALFAIMDDNVSLQDRLVGTGTLPFELASRLGCVGYVGRASAQDYDVRRDSPYPPYDALALRIPVLQEGDVAARMRLRAEEIKASCALLGELLATLPSGPTSVGWEPPALDAEGLGIVEGWRGEVIAYVRFGAGGNIERYFPRDPSWLNWPALELLIRDNIVPDFPVCNKSVNGSYSGHDL
jgi:Ni,Fe-hydrogenase III large subunit